MLTKLKQKVQQMLTAEAKAANRLGLTPNATSIIGFILALLSAFAYAYGQHSTPYLLLATTLLLLSGFCDALDGVIARLFQQTSAFGGFLDSLLDRYADAAVIAGIILAALCDTTWGLMAMAGSMLVSYSRARAEATGVKMESVGLAERAERIILLTIATLATIYWSQALNIGIIMIAVLSHLTVLQRSLYVHSKLKKGN